MIADREWSGEIRNRLDRVGRYHASRTILCAVQAGRETIDAIATIRPDERSVRPGKIAIGHELVVLDVGERHLRSLRTVVDPLLVSDLSTLVWAPHGHRAAVDELLDMAQIVLIDSDGEPDPNPAVRRASGLAHKAYVVDLAWLRSTPWRERVAATFDPDQWRPELGRLSAISVRHKRDSVLAGLLFCGWLCQRLGWEPEGLLCEDGSLEGVARAQGREITLALHPDDSMISPGLAGVTLKSTGGMSISLDRGVGGLVARRRDASGDEREWTVLGASRGEAGILGEGIRQALLRDSGYGPALSAAAAFAARSC